MAIAEVSIVPIGTGTSSLSRYVADVIMILQNEKGVKHELTAMGTIIEGDLDIIIAVVRKMHESVFDAGAVRVVTTLKIDDRRDKNATTSKKLEPVRQKLAEKQVT